MGGVEYERRKGYGKPSTLSSKMINDLVSLAITKQKPQKQGEERHAYHAQCNCTMGTIPLRPDGCFFDCPRSLFFIYGLFFKW